MFDILLALVERAGEIVEKDELRNTFAKANLPAEIEEYAAAHGWCPPDSRVYIEPLAEKAWSRLLAPYSKALVQHPSSS